jgi:hypothetical protein
MEIKSPYNQTKNIEKGHSRKIEQGEDIISEFEDKIEIKEKTRNLSQTTQEL